MKRLIILIAILVLFLVGCNELDTLLNDVNHMIEEIETTQEEKDCCPPEIIDEPSEPILDDLPILICSIELDETTEYETIISELTQAFVYRIIDGDTIDVLIDGESNRVRLIGVDAPEMGRFGSPDGAEPGAIEATDFVHSLTYQTYVWLEIDGDNYCSRGTRLRRYVWLAIPSNINNETYIRELMLNAILLEQGYASVMIIGSVRHETLFRYLCQQ